MCTKQEHNKGFARQSSSSEVERPRSSIGNSSRRTLEICKLLPFDAHNNVHCTQTCLEEQINAVTQRDAICRNSEDRPRFLTSLLFVLIARWFNIHMHVNNSAANATQRSSLNLSHRANRHKVSHDNISAQYASAHDSCTSL